MAARSALTPWGGLVSDLDRVTTIAENIRETNSDDYHYCDCRKWGIVAYGESLVIQTPNSQRMQSI